MPPDTNGEFRGGVAEALNSLKQSVDSLRTEVQRYHKDAQRCRESQIGQHTAIDYRLGALERARTVEAKKKFSRGQVILAATLAFVGTAGVMFLGFLLGKQ